MSPYKKPGRSNWYISPSLPAFGRVGPYSVGSQSKRLADQMEAMLHTLALEMPAAIWGLVQKRYSLRQLWVARQERTLEALVAHGEDPPLKTCHGQAGVYRRLVQFSSSFLRNVLRIFAGLGSLVRFGAACFATHSATQDILGEPC